jgi:hypothetical protein
MYFSPHWITTAYGHSLLGKITLNLLLCGIYSLILLVNLFIYSLVIWDLRFSECGIHVLTFQLAVMMEVVASSET